MAFLRRKRNKGQHKKARDGFTPAEVLASKDRAVALRIARESLTAFLHGGSYDLFDPLRGIFRRTMSVDVSLWVAGVFRGSRIVTDLSLAEGIVKAARLAARDPRYKPVSFAELADTRIEICVLSDHVTDLTADDLARNEIAFDRGYRIEHAGAQGWFLPTLFNIKKAYALKDLLRDLAVEKAKVSFDAAMRDKQTRWTSFAVQNFIEDDAFGGVVDLNGPVVHENTYDSERSLRAAADSIIALQEDDGNFIPIFRSLSGERTQMDWPRSALAGWALAEYGAVTGEDRYRDAAQKNLDYLTRSVDQDESTVPYLALVLSYMGQTALTLGQVDCARGFADRISGMSTSVPYHPVVFQQIASFLAGMVHVGETRYLDTATSMADRAYHTFDADVRRGKDVFLAQYAELANMFLVLYRTTGSVVYLRHAGVVARWLASHQLPSGAFRISPASLYSNVRGSAKIIEVLAAGASLDGHEQLLFGDHAEAIRRCSVWLSTMQYDKTNTFFVKPDAQRFVLGGFRHTYGDPDVWIDAAAHFVLAQTRLRYIESGSSLNSGKLVVLHPVRNASLLIEAAPPESRAYYFFKRRFALEKIIFRAVDTVSRMTGLAVFGSVEQNDTMRNYRYIWKHLVYKRVVRNTGFDRLLRYKFFPGTPGFFTIDPEVCYAEGVTDGNDTSRFYAHGFSKRWFVAVGQAIGEILERYPYSIYQCAQFVRASIGSLKKRGLAHMDIDAMVRFSPEQAAYDPSRMWDEESEFYWEPVVRYSTGKNILAPVQTIYWNYRAEGEPRLRESNTSGLGGGFSKEQAILSGLYELIERDAYFLYWLNGIAPIRIDPATVLSEAFQGLYRESVKAGVEVICLYAPTDIGVPALFTILHDPNPEAPCFVMGGGCNCDPVRALTRSLEEAWSIYYWSRSKSKGRYEVFPNGAKPFTTAIPIDKRVSAWSNRTMEGALDFFIAQTVQPFDSIAFGEAYTDIADELRGVIRSVESLGSGYEVYAHFSDHPVLSSTGYHAARVIVPALSPMYYNEKNAPLANGRARAFGAFHAKDPASGFNPLPHLFP